MEVYASDGTLTTGLNSYFAVFINSDYMEATSAASANYIGFGNAGANINRESFSLPGTTGEYLYTGTYGSTRTFSDRGGIEIVYGDLTLKLDELDLDPLGELQGTISASVTNRTRAGLAGAANLGELPRIVLAEVRFNTATGVWENAAATTSDPDGDVRSTGTYEGLIGGPVGEEVGGYSIIEGTADIQILEYEVVTYDIDTTILLADGVTTATITTTSTVTGLANIEDGALQNAIDARVNVADAFGAGVNGVLQADVPAGAYNQNTRTEFRELSTSYSAREIGVFVGEQVFDPAFP